MSPFPSIAKADEYVSYLNRMIRTDPGRRSALRRGLGRPVEDPMVRKSHAVVAPRLPTGSSRAVESAYYSVAALIATQPSGRKESDEPTPPASVEEEKTARPTTSIGGTLGAAVHSGKLNPDTVEARLHLLCRQDIAGLHRQLPGLLRHLTAKEITPDWARLLVDLSWWGASRDRVTKRWLQDYYRSTKPEGSTKPETEGEDQ